MARRRKADGSGVQFSTSSSSSSTVPASSMSPPPQSTAGSPPTRRRGTVRDAHGSSSSSGHGLGMGVNGADVTPKVINAAPSLEKAQRYGIENDRSAWSKLMALAGRMFIETIPQVLSVGVMLGLIFGGCCSNVFALEAIVKVEPASGYLLTFVQFLFIAITGYISQFDSSRPPFYIAPNKVPIRRWLWNVVLFFSVNVLNNHAFSYDISVPVHIILRSGGSVVTMLAGFLYGKRYSQTQVVAVLLLTAGVVMAAWSDAQAKGNTTTSQEAPSFSMGLAILFLAQVLSAVMGLYTEATYQKYGGHWQENLFYCHLLSLPLFLPWMSSITEPFMKLTKSPPLTLPAIPQWLLGSNITVPIGLQKLLDSISIPSQLAYLFLNVLTQTACIRGVNLLAANSSALTVTIVLNVRKLVSLLLSIWLFANKLAPGTLVGAIIVFAAGGMYSLDGSGGRAKAKPRAKIG